MSATTPPTISAAAPPWATPRFAAAPPGRRALPWGVPEYFLLGEFLFQLVLIVPALNGSGTLRIVWRTGAFAASLALLFMLRGKTRSTPVNIAALWVMAILGLELFHPTTNTLLAGLAEDAMYLASLAPLFWLSRVSIDAPRLRRIVRILWVYYTLSASVGLLQVYYPGRFQPNLSPAFASMGSSVEGLKITLPGGARIFRPMGLTDTPGGAASAGLWAVLFGLGFLLTLRPGRGRRLRQAVFLASMAVGVAVIYLSQMRSAVVILALMLASVLAILAWYRRWRQLIQLAGLTLAVMGLGLVWSLRLGGAHVTNRYQALTGSKTGSSLYSSERGFFLQQAIHDELPQFPFGAGLGRWGMMNSYFGDNNDPERASIYVEIQWQGWILDGGIPLLAAYLILLGLAMARLARAARRRGPLWVWALVCLAYDVAILALTFDYTPFTGEPGMEFWFINALILTAVACIESQPRPAPPPAVVWMAAPPPA